MKTVYIDMVVLLYLMQILIGSSHGLLSIISLGNQSGDPRLLATLATTPMPTPPEGNCSTITCASKYEQCKEYDDLTVSCICSQLAFRNHATGRCEPKYRWVNYTPDLWNNRKLWVVKGGVYNCLFVLVRLVFNHGNKIPLHTLICPFEKKLVPFRTNAGQVVRIEVLLIDRKHYDWVPSENGIIETNAIEGGNTGKEKLYICSREDYYPYAGVMKPSSHACFRGRSSKLKRNYKLLVYRKNSG